MAQHQIRRLPVVDSGQLIGMLALGDLAIRESADDRSWICLERNLRAYRVN